MLEGKTADPEDLFRSFMLNGYAYLGMARVAEMLESIDPAQSKRWRTEADALKRDIRTAAFETMGRSPVIPLANGAWCPTLPPWVEYRGPLSLYADGGLWFSHWSMMTRDSLLGPIYLIFQEVIDPNEPAATFLLNFHNDLMTTRNAAFTQPYYSRHPISHLRRGEVKPFLKAYYNTMASLADRQTYTFWEHYIGVSPHKTHEEGWFLMDTRWMLYMERGKGIDLLPGVPRSYLENGKHIELDKVATYFGPLSLSVTSALDQGRIRATVECQGDRKPAFVDLRIPHPQGRKAIRVEGGVYNPRPSVSESNRFPTRRCNGNVRIREDRRQKSEVRIKKGRRQKAEEKKKKLLTAETCFAFFSLGFGLWALGFGLWALGFGLWTYFPKEFAYAEQKRFSENRRARSGGIEPSPAGAGVAERGRGSFRVHPFVESHRKRCSSCGRTWIIN